jgi:hypothetical protein
MFNNNSASPPYLSGNYISQGITGVRFQYGLGGGEYSTPFLFTYTSGGSPPYVYKGMSTAWTANLSSFFLDLASYGIVRVTPTPALIEPWSGCVAGVGTGCTITALVGSISTCTGYDSGGVNKMTYLYNYPWLPFGLAPFNPAVQDYRPDCQDDNNAYNDASGNPAFWGWNALFDVVDATLSTAQSTHLRVDDLDLQNEVNLFDFTVLGRLIYDTKHTSQLMNWPTTEGCTVPSPMVDVYCAIQQKMSARNFAIGLATFSTQFMRPTVDGDDCASVYGDSAMNIYAAELFAAFDGGLIGWPNGFTYPSTNGLACLGSGTGMFTFPVAYTQPTVTDMHIHICVADTAGGCQAIPSTLTALTFYNTLYQSATLGFLPYRNLTSNYLVFGETNHTLPTVCDGYIGTRAFDNVNGFITSSLKTFLATSGRTGLFNNAAFRVWNNEADDTAFCHILPNAINPPYTP